MAAHAFTHHRRLETQTAFVEAPVEEQQQQIRLRAYELYLERGSIDGFDLQDWFQAEAEIAEIAETGSVRTASATGD